MKNRVSIIISLIISFFVIFFSISCTRQAESTPTSAAPESESELLLGTSCRITIYSDHEAADFTAAFDRIREIEQLMSRSIADSEISLVNERAGTGVYTQLSEDTLQVLKEALLIAGVSDGAFDPTIGPLVSAWGIGSDDARIPGEQEITDLLAYVDYREVEIDEASGSVLLPRTGMALDLGAIAKGYAADAVREVLLDRGIGTAIVNLGGNVLTVGTKPDGSRWKIGIQDPLSDRGEYLAIATMTEHAVVTSGVYERYFIVDDVRYHHILDTETGYPVESGLLGVSIITGDSFLADALSTAAFSLGIERGMELVDSYEGTEAVFITTDKEILMSAGMTGGDITLTLQDDSYTYR